MFRQHELISSQAMGRPMNVWRYGHFGPPAIVFPSASGIAHEWEAHGMIEALGGLLEGGKLKLYSTETNVSEAWTAGHGDPGWRLHRHQAFERYVVSELVPLIRRDCQAPDIRIAVTGCSLGAFYAANFALKHPEIFHWALCMSGRYDMSEFLAGAGSLDAYFNNPMAFVPNLDGEMLERVRRGTHLVLVCGQGQWENGNIEETQRLADLLGDKGISHEKDLWGHDVSHEWPWWQRQAVHHFERVLAR